MLSNEQFAELKEIGKSKFIHKNVDIGKELNTKNINRKRFYETPNGDLFPSITTVLSNYKKEGLWHWRKKVGEDVLVLSLEIKTTFLKSVNPGPVTVIGRVIKAGKSIAFLEGELRDNQNILLAKANQTAKLKYNFYK